jgi:glycosyltransferase involved in cell wall biosynthesis
VRIGFNLLHALPEVGGVWNYISNLVASLAREDSHHEYVAFVTDASAALVANHSTIRSVPIPIHSAVRAQRVLFENTVLQALVWRERLDCLHWFANTQGIFNMVPAVVTVYDLQPFLEYAEMSSAKRTFLRWRMRDTVKRAAMLLPMSQATGVDLQQMLGADPRRMIVVPPILEPMFQPPDGAAIKRLRERHRLPPEFWLYVAHAYPHKNHERLLQAYRAVTLENPDAWPLVLRGDAQPGSPGLGELSTRLGLSGRVIVLPRLNREELPALYGAASALIFPSLYEGGGIPVLEAQACGCPIVASDIAAIREFAGDAAHYINPASVGDMKRAMMAITAAPSTRANMRQLGLERARCFRDIPVVHHLLEAYSRAGAMGDFRGRG